MSATQIQQLNDLLVDPSNYECESDDIDPGSFGSISIVHHKDKPEVQIALKKVPSTEDADRITQQSFIREITGMHFFRHPCIIELLGYSLPSKSNPYYHIYMPFLPNKNLQQVLQEDQHKADNCRQLTPTIKSKIVYGVASAMSYLHSSDLLHRDLKPLNILLDKDYNPVICDFGLSRIFNPEEMSNRVGSYAYMAPEMLIKDNVAFTKQIDVYSYALVLLQMFSPDLKFEKKCRFQTFAKDINNGVRFIIPDEVPNFYVDLIKKCWETNPNSRPTFNEIVELFENKFNEFIFPGSNPDAVRDFIDALNEVGNSDVLPSSSASTETPEFEFI